MHRKVPIKLPIKGSKGPSGDRLDRMFQVFLSKSVYLIVHLIFLIILFRFLRDIMKGEKGLTYVDKDLYNCT